MEITLGCQSASVSVLDSNYVEVVYYDNIKVVGDTGLCQADVYESKLERKAYGRKPNRR